LIETGWQSLISFEKPATEQSTAAQSYFGDYLPSAQHLFGDQAINDLMRHYGGAVSGSSST
jgi:hypothetical protein